MDFGMINKSISVNEVNAWWFGLWMVNNSKTVVEASLNMLSHLKHIMPNIDNMLFHCQSIKGFCFGPLFCCLSYIVPTYRAGESRTSWPQSSDTDVVSGRNHIFLILSWSMRAHSVSVIKVRVRLDIYRCWIKIRHSRQRYSFPGKFEHHKVLARRRKIILLSEKATIWPSKWGILRGHLTVNSNKN